MVSPHDPAVEVSPERETESPETARAKQLAASLNVLEEALDPQPRPISGKRAAEKLADSRRLLESRIESIPDFERHSRKCQVCHSRWVEEIEEAYFNWSSAQWIINSFNISYDDAVYRHARAIGLDVKRRKNVVIALEKLIEKVDEVTVTSSTVIRAVRALSCLDAAGRWTDLSTTHIVMSTKDLPTGTDWPSRTSATANPFAEVGSISSSERSEDAFRKGTALAVPKAAANSGVSTPEVRLSVGSISSTERSEPASQTDAPENESAVANSSSIERSEPHRASDSTIPESKNESSSSTSFAQQANEPLSSLATCHSPLDSNRGTYEKLEIPTTCTKQSAEVNSNRGNFRD